MWFCDSRNHVALYCISSFIRPSRRSVHLNRFVFFSPRCPPLAFLWCSSRLERRSTPADVHSLPHSLMGSGACSASDGPVPTLIPLQMERRDSVFHSFVFLLRLLSVVRFPVGFSGRTSKNSTRELRNNAITLAFLLLYS